MQVRAAIFVLAVTALLATSALAQGTLVPRYTVIPVVLENGLNSATSRVGDTFYARCGAANCAGFPTGTRFTGRVVSVVPASGTTPGQIDVNFVQATLPNGTVLPISGQLSSLGENAVTTDPQTGQLTARVERRNDRNKFIYYGAGAGVLIGALTGNVLRGGLIGAAAGWLAGALTRGQAAKNVDVPPGTEFGIMLNSAVTVPAAGGAGPGTTQPCPPCPPAGSGPAEGWNVVLTQQQPFRTNAGVLMVPLRDVMVAIGQPFTYSSANRTISMNTQMGLITHAAGTRTVYDDGTAVSLTAPSRIIGGTLYVPADFLTVALGRSATWRSADRTLVVR